jgi:hypothetical protein
MNPLYSKWEVRKTTEIFISIVLITEFAMARTKGPTPKKTPRTGPQPRKVRVVGNKPVTTTVSSGKVRKVSFIYLDNS